jgi:integrase
LEPAGFLRLKTLWSDGTAALQLSRSELLQRILALIPSRRKNDIPTREGYVLREAPDTATSVLGHWTSRASARAGVEPFSPMGLRRLAEDELYRRVGDPSAAARFLGHSPRMAMEHHRRVNAMDLRQAMEAADLGKVPEGKVIELEPRIGTAHKAG